MSIFNALMFLIYLIMNGVTVTFDQFNACFMNRSIVYMVTLYFDSPL